MKRIFSLLVLSAFVSSCAKDDPSVDAYIYAGAKVNRGYYFDFNPNKHLELAYPGGPTTENEIVYLDLDNDSVNDIAFQSMAGMFAAGNTYSSFHHPQQSTDAANPPTKGAAVYVLNTNTTLSTKWFSKNDMIDRDGGWQPGEGSWLLSNFTPAGSSAAIEDNPWTQGATYLGVKVKKGNHIRYGWVGLQIEGYDSVIVRDFAVTE